MPGYKNGNWHRKMCYTYNENKKKMNNRRNRTTKSRKNQNIWRKGKLLVLRNIGSGHHQTSGDERKNKKRMPQMNEKVSWNLLKRINTWAVSFWRNMGPFLQKTKEELTQINQRTKKLMMHKALHPRNDGQTVYAKKRRRKRTHQHWK